MPTQHHPTLTKQRQELVATKVELAQLKEQQLVVQRQLRQASLAGKAPPPAAAAAAGGGVRSTGGAE